MQLFFLSAISSESNFTIADIKIIYYLKKLYFFKTNHKIH